MRSSIGNTFARFQIAQRHGREQILVDAEHAALASAQLVNVTLDRRLPPTTRAMLRMSQVSVF
jgi:hypothetical protein